MADFSNNEGEDRWIVTERHRIIAYLERQRVDHQGVGERPAFHVAPVFAVWAVQSKARPGWVGWWAFSGDMPCDYISRGQADDPRKALGELVRRWRRFLPHLRDGRNPPGVDFSEPTSLCELGDLLARRVTLLEEWFTNDALWVDILGN